MATATEGGQGELKCFRAVVHGRVQGVNFRYYTWVRAESLGLVGYVRNLPGGGVEVVAEGQEDSLHRLLSWLHTGPSWARVSQIKVQWRPPKGRCQHFEVRY